MVLPHNLLGAFAAQGLQGAIGGAQQAQNMASNNLFGTSLANVAAQQQQAYNNMLAQSNAYGSSQSGKITGEAHTPATSKELEHEAYNVSVENLINLWVTRWGNEWADLSEIEQDEFFRLAYRRLKQMGELETHYLTDRARYVCRRPE
jgi:hypothetical protein